MNRREYLSCVATTGLVGMGGCLGEATEAVENASRGSRMFGEVVKHRGVEVVPTQWMTTNEVTFDVDQGMTQSKTPAPGAEFLLTHIQAKRRRAKA